MAIDTIKSSAVLDGAIATADIADDAVTSAKLGSGAVDTTALGASAVTNAKIANSTLDLTAKVTGALPVANGGTALTSGFLNGGMVQSSAVTTFRRCYLSNHWYSYSRTKNHIKHIWC